MSNKKERAKKVLFIIEDATLAHVARPLTLARFLRQKGYAVSFASGLKYGEIISKYEFEPYILPSIGTEEFLKRVRYPAKPLYTHREMKEYVEAEKALIKQVRPDLIVGDFRYSLGISSEIAAVPYCAIVNAYWNPRAQIYPHVFDNKLVKIFGEKIAQKVFDKCTPLFKKYHLRSFNLIRKKYSLAPLKHADEILMRADFIVHPDAPFLYPLSGDSGREKFIGPVFPRFPIEMPGWWENIPSGRPLVYISLGSSGNFKLLKKILAAVRTLPITAVVASARDGVFSSQTGNIFMEKYLPAEKILEKAALAISNGGSASTDQALSFGVPVLGFPSNIDQFLSMPLVVGYGAGEIIRPSKATILNIREKVKEMLGKKKYRQAAGVLSREMKKYNAEEEFVSFVEKILEN